MPRSHTYATSRGAALGAAGYLVKPVSRDDLLGALTEIGLPVEAGDSVERTEAP